MESKLFLSHRDLNTALRTLTGQDGPSVQASTPTGVCVKFPSVSLDVKYLSVSADIVLDSLAVSVSSTSLKDGGLDVTFTVTPTSGSRE